MKKDLDHQVPAHEVPAHQVLSELFKTIIEEAEKNPAFAEKMIEAFPEAIGAKVNGGKANDTSVKPSAKKKTATKAASKVKASKPLTSNKQSFDPNDFNPVVLLRRHGEDLCRIKLNKLSAANLKTLAKHFKIKTLSKKSPTKPELLKALTDFAKHYDKQTKGAAA